MAVIDECWLLQIVCIVVAMLKMQVTDAVMILRPTKIHTLNLYNNEEYVNHTVEYTLNPPKMHITLNIKKQADNVDMVIDGYLRDTKRPQYYSKIDLRWNFCRALSFIESSAVGAFLFGYLKKFGDVIDSCPIKPATYVMNNFYIPEMEASSVLPEFEFEFLVSFYAVDSKGAAVLGLRDYVSGLLSHVDVPASEIRGILS